MINFRTKDFDRTETMSNVNFIKDQASALFNFIDSFRLDENSPKTRGLINGVGT